MLLKVKHSPCGTGPISEGDSAHMLEGGDSCTWKTALLHLILQAVCCVLLHQRLKLGRAFHRGAHYSSHCWTGTTTSNSEPLSVGLKLFRLSLA